MKTILMYRMVFFSRCGAKHTRGRGMKPRKRGEAPRKKVTVKQLAFREKGTSRGTTPRLVIINES